MLPWWGWLLLAWAGGGGIFGACLAAIAKQSDQELDVILGTPGEHDTGVAEEWPTISDAEVARHRETHTRAGQ
jgi:hypothetical protein